MAEPLLATAPAPQESLFHDGLLLRETHHRCSNNLQPVVGLLSLQRPRATNLETRDALAEAIGRVAVLARARPDLNQRRQLSEEGALRQVCEALHSQAEPRFILASMQAEHDEVQNLAPDHISTLALVVSELAMNASKHAFQEGKGHINIAMRRDGERQAVIIVVDRKWFIIVLQMGVSTTQDVGILLLHRRYGDWLRLDLIRSRRSQ